MDIKDLPQTFIDTQMNKLMQWHRSGTGHGLLDFPTGNRYAVLHYMLRSLNRGQVPNLKLVQDALDGSVPVPECGYIGCTSECGFTHTH